MQFLKLGLEHGGEIHRSQHQGRKSTVARNISQDITGKREQQPWTFDQKNWLQVLVRNVKGKDPGVFKLKDKRDLLLDLAFGLKPDNNLENLVLKRIGVDVDVDVNIGRRLLHEAENAGRRRGFERQVLDKLGVNGNGLRLLGAADLSRRFFFFGGGRLIFFGFSGHLFFLPSKSGPVAIMDRGREQPFRAP